MSKPISLLASRTLCALGTVVIVVVLSGDLAAGEPAPGVWVPGPPPVPPRGPLFVVPAIPSPIPIPLPIPNRPPFPLRFPFSYPYAAVTPVPGSTDPCLVVASPETDSRFVVTASAAIDPGFIKEPRVEGLPIRSPGEWQGFVTPWEPNERPTIGRWRR